ncbi:MAG: hypothetical protein ACRCST_02275 [Turicibacter sp.]
MEKYTKEDLNEAHNVISSIISNCEKMQPKFLEGTSQHSLLKNRIKAMYISKTLLTKSEIVDNYTTDELIQALPPVTSIISKCEKTQLKFAEGNGHHTRLKNMITAMNISKKLITDEISQRETFYIAESELFG